jgi:hypothetical protein
MRLTKLKISFCLALATVVAGLVFSAGATARIPVEPGPGSPVTPKQVREPAAQKATRRNDGGFPARSGVHVRVPAELQAELRTE